MPLVSILTPTWNRAKYLHKTWAGLTSQKYSNIEWVIGNDGSTDNTTEVCLGFKKKSQFPVVILDCNVRVGKARMDNELMKTAKGDFWVWCDSDDYLLPDCIARLVNIWKSMERKDQERTVGLTALCSTKDGVLQSNKPGRKGIFETTWRELDQVYRANTDMLIFFNADKVRGCSFNEVDFMVSEGSLWHKFFDMRTLFIPEVMKIMYRGADNRISFSGKMEYCRGKAYSIAESEEYTSEDYCYGSKYIWRVICFHRYCIHGDIQLFEAKKLWASRLPLLAWLMLYPIGLLLAIKDTAQRKVVKTHIEFEENKKRAVIRVLDGFTT